MAKKNTASYSCELHWDEKGDKYGMITNTKVTFLAFYKYRIVITGIAYSAPMSLQTWYSDSVQAWYSTSFPSNYSTLQFYKKSIVLSSIGWRVRFMWMKNVQKRRILLFIYRKHLIYNTCLITWICFMAYFSKLAYLCKIQNIFLV